MFKHMKIPYLLEWVNSGALQVFSDKLKISTLKYVNNGKKYKMIYSSPISFISLKIISMSFQYI